MVPNRATHQIMSIFHEILKFFAAGVSTTLILYLYGEFLRRIEAYFRPSQAYMMIVMDV